MPPFVRAKTVENIWYQNCFCSKQLSPPLRAPSPSVKVNCWKHFTWALFSLKLRLQHQYYGKSEQYASTIRRQKVKHRLALWWRYWCQTYSNLAQITEFLDIWIHCQTCKVQRDRVVQNNTMSWIVSMVHRLQNHLTISVASFKHMFGNLPSLFSIYI